MALLTIAAALLALFGACGTVAVFAIPAWRPRGQQKRAALLRLFAFLVCFGGGIAIIAVNPAATVTLIG